MMQGYNKEQALAFIVPKIDLRVHKELSDRIGALISQAIDADMAYMVQAGVIDEEGYAGDSYYEDDEALEYMVEALVAQNDLSPDQAVKVAALVDDYMDLQQAFLEYCGLVEWD